MEAQWYLLDGEVTVGPLSYIELQHKLKTRAGQPDVFVWREGMQSWVHLSEMGTQAEKQEASKSPQRSADVSATETNSRPSKASTWLGAAIIGFVCVVVVKPILTRFFEPSREELINQAFERVLPAIRAPLPKKVDEITTLVSVRVEGINMIYTNEIPSNFEFADAAAVLNALTERVCKSEMVNAIRIGARYTYEYRQPPPDRKLVNSVTISQCP